MQAYNMLNGTSWKHKLANRLLPDISLGDMNIPSTTGAEIGTRLAGKGSESPHNNA